jgi:hypothetical protein
MNHRKNPRIPMDQLLGPCASSPSVPKVPTISAGRFNLSQDLLVAKEPQLETVGELMGFWL